MKKLMTIALAGVALSLTACAGTETEADYSYESQAPYAEDRTVGADSDVERAEPVRVFEDAQRK